MVAANRHDWEREGKGRGISAQLWNLRDKIRDVDTIMTPALQTTIGEAHPAATVSSMPVPAPSLRATARSASAATRSIRMEINYRGGRWAFGKIWQLI